HENLINIGLVHRAGRHVRYLCAAYTQCVDEAGLGQTKLECAPIDLAEFKGFTRIKDRADSIDY
ncbi:MAG: hypothetical protein HOH40_03270, partial [Oceanospirillaceae bacterium]|nr:hypothetical protein [Oceanospirillaceae bacterium]